MISSIELSKITGIEHESIKNRCVEYNLHAKENDCDNIEIRDNDIYFLDEPESYGISSSYSTDVFNRVMDWWTSKREEDARKSAEVLFLLKFRESFRGSNIRYAKKKQKTYVMYDSTFKSYKIGKSINPTIRERTLGAQFPNISLFATCADDIEFELHEKYKNKRIRGEWFDLNNNDLKEIMKLGFNVV